MAWLRLILLLLGVVARGAHSLTFKVVWMAPTSQYKNVMAGSSVGAFKLAMDDITAATAHAFDVDYRDSDCNSKTALSQIHDVIVRDAFDPEVIIGPPCSDAMLYIGQLAGYRDLSVVGWVSDSPDFGDKSTYNTMIRVLPPINAMAKGVFQVLTEYSWKRVFLMSSTGYPYHELGTTINDDIKAREAQDYVITRWIEGEPVNPDVARMDEVFALVQKEARIMILAVPLSELRSWMIQAQSNKMTAGDYVFIYLNPDLATDDVISNIRAASMWQQGDASDDCAREAFENVLILAPKSYEPDPSFFTDADSAATSGGYDTSLGLTASPSDKYSPYLYDAMRVYAVLADEVDGSGGTYTSGAELFAAAQTRSFSGSDYVTSPILLDENADRLPDFWLLDLASDGAMVSTLSIESVISGGAISTSNKEKALVIWGDGSVGKENAPPDTPVCGFSNENCPDLVLYIVPPVVVCLLILIAVAAYLIHRKLQFERSIKDMAWMLNKDDLKTTKKKDRLSAMMVGSHGSSIRRSRASALGSHRTLSHVSLGRKSGTVSMVSSAADDRSQIFVNIVKYKTEMVAVRRIHKPRIKIDRELLVEMRTMTHMKNTNLAQLIGATTEPPEMLEVWEYCSKGSLQDVIWNDNISFEDMFKFSIAVDIFKGLKYLQDSPIKCHGRLKSSNCVIDGRWVCKLTDYGLFRLRDGASDDPEMTDYARSARLQWTAPELLRNAPKNGKITEMSQEADIYAGAVILKEIFARNGPYTEQEDDMEPDEILEKIKATPSATLSSFRPSLAEVKGHAPDKMLDLIKIGWSEKPSDRPSPGHMVKDLQRINPNKSANVMDNMVRMMERYTNHLEEVVGERTEQVEVEKKKSEMLLYRMLPKPIAEDLKRGKAIEAESYDSVSLYFSDIVKFTALSAQSTPMQVVDLLNGLYTIFDSAIANHDVYKVETIGDAYMLVSGLPQRNGDRHAVEIANCAMDLLSGILNFKVAHMPEDYELRLRIGLHTGPAVAGVVGLTMPRYCLFGNTVTIAQTMESGGQPMRIHMSQYTYDILKKYSGYYLAARNDPIDIKGLGKTNTYWLINKKGYEKPMPDFTALAEEDSPRPTIFPISSGKEFRPSVTESGIFELESEDQDPSRKTSAVDPELEQISEKSLENMRSDQDVTSDVAKESHSEGNSLLSLDNEPDTHAEPEQGRKTRNYPNARAVLVREDPAASVEPDSDPSVLITPDNTKNGDVNIHENIEKQFEDPWANPGKAAGLKTAKDEPTPEPTELRPTTAKSIRERLRIAKPNKIADMTLEDTNISDDDDDSSATE